MEQLKELLVERAAEVGATFTCPELALAGILEREGWSRGTALAKFRQDAFLDYIRREFGFTLRLPFIDSEHIP